MPNYRTNCGDCGVSPGSLHVLGCDVERCRNCGGQYISCDCGDPDDEAQRLPRIPWTGVWPDIEECRQYGLYCKRAKGPGWVPCSPDDPEATEDLNRLVIEGRWNKEKAIFEMP